MSELKNICLIVPCYNEAERLDIAEYKKYSEGIHFLFVNDGSSDNTLELLQKEASGFASILNLDKNSGKAEAVRRGMLHLEELPLYGEIEWAGFWDADLATPLAELDGIYKAGVSDGADAVFGVRVKKTGSVIKRSKMRHVISRIFCMLFRFFYGIKTRDSQCGAKIFRKNIVINAFSEPFVSRWIFDVELIIRLKGQKITEYPVSRWTEVGGSKVVKMSSFSVIIRDMYRIWKKYI